MRLRMYLSARMSKKFKGELNITHLYNFFCEAMNNVMKVTKYLLFDLVFRYNKDWSLMLKTCSKVAAQHYTQVNLQLNDPC